MANEHETHAVWTQNPLLMSQYQRSDLAAEMQLYNAEYQEHFPIIVAPEDAEHLNNVIDAHKQPEHTTAMSVIKDINDRIRFAEEIRESRDYDEDGYYHDDDDWRYQKPPAPPSDFRIIASEYMRMSDEMRKNPDEMLTLIAWRPDTILWVDPSIYEQRPDFAIQAMQRNPLVYEMLPQEVQQNPAIVDRYRDILYGNGFVQDPTCNFSVEERARENVAAMYDLEYMSAASFECIYMKKYEEAVEEEMHRIPVPDVNFRKNPSCTDELMFTKEGYEKIFGEVLMHPTAHPIQDTYYNGYTGSKALQFIAVCETQLPHEMCHEARINAYQSNLNAIRNNATDDYTKVCLAQFCDKHGLEAQPEWQTEYNLIKQGHNPFDLITLRDLACRLDKYNNLYNVDFKTAQLPVVMMNTWPIETIEQNIDLQKWGETFGEFIAAQVTELDIQEVQFDLETQIEEIQNNAYLDPETKTLITQAMSKGYEQEMSELELEYGPTIFGE